MLAGLNSSTLATMLSRRMGRERNEKTPISERFSAPRTIVSGAMRERLA
jgi:hypothetical protein